MPHPLSIFSKASPWLDNVASTLHGLATPLFGEDGPAAIKDVLYGTWMGHPLHPPMTDITIGGWTLSMMMDVLGAEKASDLALQIGTLSAGGTALSGIAQWYDLQNMEEPRRLGAYHATLNTVALGFYVTSIVLRKQDKRGAGIATAWTGHALSTTSAWIGGHLSFGLGIGVSRDAFTDVAGDWTDAVEETALPEGELVRAEVEGAPIMLLRQGDRILATSAVCTHVGGPLDEGERNGTCVTCPWHYSEFDMATGGVVHGPATASLDTYDTRVSNGMVQIRIQPA